MGDRNRAFGAAARDGAARDRPARGAAACRRRARGGLRQHQRGEARRGRRGRRETKRWQKRTRRHAEAPGAADPRRCAAGLGCGDRGLGRDLGVEHVLPARHHGAACPPAGRVRQARRARVRQPRAAPGARGGKAGEPPHRAVLARRARGLPVPDRGWRRTVRPAAALAGRESRERALQVGKRVRQETAARPAKARAAGGGR
mmetsp:Transcript_3269/g.7679  ORF Transcript_3269/g.7679 Transcript_3269/m.7679 type:complete len:202 (+) Transcript_3269:494-1099(+)